MKSIPRLVTRLIAAYLPLTTLHGQNAPATEGGTLEVAPLVALPQPASTVSYDEFDGLSWPATPGAQSYHVYFGTSLQAVGAAVTGSPQHIGSAAGNRFDFNPSPAWGYRYYWRIDTVTASGTIKGEVRHFDIPFPSLAGPLAFPVPSSTQGIMLDAGSNLIATNYQGLAASYAIDSADGTLSFEQSIGGGAANQSTGHSDVAVCGQGWILRARGGWEFSEGPPVADTWSRDAFQGHWRQRQPLMFSPPASAESSVGSLAADGGHLLASIQPSYPSSPGRVVACVERPRPVVIGSFQASDAVAGDAFGTSIAIDGNRALIGASGWPVRPGSAYLFEFLPQSATWVQRAKLQPSASIGSFAGTEVALDGNHAVLAPGRDLPAGGRVVHIYRSSRTGWTLNQTLAEPVPPVPGDDTGFGTAVAIKDDLLFVSQPAATVVHLEQGLINIYHLENGTWVPGAPILGPLETRGFGSSLAVRDGVLYVGSKESVHSYRLRPNSNRPPRFVNPPPARLVAGQPAAVTITATDPDGQAGLLIRSLVLPAGLSLSDHGNGSATLGGTPTAAAGSRIFAQWSVNDPQGATTYQSGFIEIIGSEDRPVFERTPASTSAGEGQSVNLTATVGDDEAVSWQWHKDNQAIDGATLPYYMIESITMENAGSYHVSVTNEAGTSHTPPAIVSVRPPDLDGGPWSTLGNSPAHTGHHKATLGRVTFVPAWSERLAEIGRLEQPVIADNRVFAGISGWQTGPLFALDLFTGETLWSTSSQDSDDADQGLSPFSQRGAPSWFDGRIHFLTGSDHSGKMNALDATTGNLLWTTSAHEIARFPAVTNRGIFYGNLHGAETDGIARFQGTGGFPSIEKDRVFAFSEGVFGEFRASDGVVIWSLVPEPVDSSAGGIVALSEDCALVIHGGTLLCVDINTRALRWHITNQFGGTPAIHNGTAYAIYRNGVMAVSLADGTVTKSYPTPAEPYNYGVGGQQPLLLNDHLLVSSVSATWVFQLASGELVQTIPAGGGILAYSNGHLIVTGGDGSTYAGNNLQAFRANSAPIFSAEMPQSIATNDAADPVTIALGSFAVDPDPGDLLTWAIVSVSRPEVFRNLEMDAQSGDLAVVYNPWESGSSDVVVSVTDPVGNVTEHTITFSVPANPDPRLELATTLTLNRQTGLYEHAITITNSGAREIAGFDLAINGLPEGVTVNNASGRDGEGWIIHHRQTLAAGASLSLVIEYYTPVRGTVLEPQVSVGLVTAPEGHPEAPDGGLAVERCVVMPDGSVMIEFTTTPGALYEIHYSDDATTWKLSPVRVRAAGNRVQWIDSGPPRTGTPPSEEKSRFYRVREVPAS